MMPIERKVSIVRSLFFVLLFSVGFGLTGCGGGGGGSTPSASAKFTPDQTNPGTNTMSLIGAVSGADFYLTVKANGVTGFIFGTAFDLTFDPDILTYVDYTAGDFFEQTGPVTYAVAARPDRLVVGVSKQQPGPAATGTGAVVTLHFKDKASGSSVTTFENQALCSTASTTVCDRKPALSWYGGTYSTS